MSTESIIATTLVEYYSVSKVDFLAHLPSDSRHVIARAVKNYQSPMIPELWDNGSNLLQDEEWKMKRAWEKYRQDLVLNDKTSSDVLKNYRYVRLLWIELTVTETDVL
jgi:hypothetical protein